MNLFMCFTSQQNSAFLSAFLYIPELSHNQLLLEDATCPSYFKETLKAE